jgi:hypothetical protein
VEVGGSQSKTSPGKSLSPYWKKKIQKQQQQKLKSQRTGSISQVVGLLPSKYKALSSMPSASEKQANKYTDKNKTSRKRK